MGAIFQIIVLVALASPAVAQSRQVFGYAGILGEWELNADVTEKTRPVPRNTPDR